MQANFWHDRWLNQQIGFHQGDINPYLIKYWQQFANNQPKKVFVPLAGKSSDLIWLADQVDEVLAVELSQLAVEAFFTENELTYQCKKVGKLNLYQAKNISFYQGDFFDLSAAMLDGVDTIFDRAALVALPESMRVAYSRHLVAITHKAPMLLVAMEYPQAQMDGPPFSVDQQMITTAYATDYEISELETVDLLADAPQFQQKGLSALLEKVYTLTPL